MFIAGFAFLTLSAASHQGFTLATGISIFVLVLLVVGIAGALLNPPRR
jgi:glycerol uptake facilitator-like aquaporin